ncbi:MAG: type II toxin-antitoxin system HicA family toxin [Vulcanimicrobiaceae bacterium]
MKFRQVRQLLRDDGWYLCRQEGSHEQYRHPEKLGRVTVAGNNGRDVPPGTLNGILKQAGLR